MVQIYEGLTKYGRTQINVKSYLYIIFLCVPIDNLDLSIGRRRSKRLFSFIILILNVDQNGSEISKTF